MSTQRLCVWQAVANHSMLATVAVGNTVMLMTEQIDDRTSAGASVRSGGILRQVTT